MFHWALNTPLIINSYFSKGSLSGAANVSWIYISLINTLNTKSTKNFKDNKAPVKLVRQYSKRVANHSNMLDRKLFKFSFDIGVKIVKNINKKKNSTNLLLWNFWWQYLNISSIVASFLWQYICIITNLRKEASGNSSKTNTKHPYRVMKMKNKTQLTSK